MTLLHEEKSARLRYQKGDTVKVHIGPFSGLVAAVELDTGTKVRACLKMFKGMVPVELDAKLVSPVQRSSNIA